MNLSFKRRSEKLVPVASIPRHRCPFYGFSAFQGAVMDTEGNQCALVVGRISPCQMKMARKTPNWDVCPCNQGEAEKLFRRIKNCTIFPREFHPAEVSEWGGMNFQDWWDYVMGDNVERPK